MIGRRLALVLVPLALVGCVSDDNAGPAGMDSGISPTDAGHPDVTLPDSSVTLIDGGYPDVAVDTGTPDATPPGVTVVVVNDLGPESGVTVVFQDASGAVLSSATTDAAGTAVAAQLAAGSQVTVLLGTPDAPQLVTVQGVQPGDVLTARDTSVDQLLGNVVAQIEAVPGSPPAGTESYEILAGNCSGSFTTPPGTVYIDNSCQSGGKFPVIVTAIGGSDAGFASLGFTTQKGNALPSDGGAPSVFLDGGWSTATSTSVAVSNAPASGNSLLQFSEVAGGVQATQQTYLPEVDPDDAGVRHVDFPIHPGYSDSQQSEVDTYVNSFPLYQVTAIGTRGAGASAHDFANALPLLTAAGVDTQDAGTLARPTVSWTSGGPLGTVDGALVVLQWSGTQDGGASYQATWTIVAPPTVTQVSAPALPASAGAWVPTDDANYVTTPVVVVVDATFLTGYADLRKTFAALPPTASLLRANSGPFVPPLPVDGTLRLTATTQSGD